MPGSVNSKLSKDETLVLEYFQEKKSKPPKVPSSARSSKKDATPRDYNTAFSSAAAPVASSSPSPSLAGVDAANNSNGMTAEEATAQKMIDEFDTSIPVAELSEQKRRDYGYGVPQWSPYRMTKVTQTEAWQKNQWSTRNGEWGSFTKEKNSLDPKMQSRLARSLVIEMR